jgi:5-methylcytosine-specific restriction endonuclease McrA
MTWRGPRESGKDPLLARSSHYKRNRKHWQRLRLPCAVCGRPIDYDGPRYVNGRQNGRALVVGHIVSRYHAKRLGWTEAMINSISNSQPECQRCSNRTGAQLGQRVQHANAKIRVKVGASDRDRW